MSTAFFLSIFLVLGVVYLALGIFVSQRIKNVKDYFLAGRDLGIGALTFTLVATQIGGGMLLGTANAAYADGYLGVFYSIGMSIGFLLLGFGLGARLREFNVVTTAELFQTKYGSTFLRKIAGMISALSMIGIFAGQVVASRALFSVLGIATEGVLILFWIFVITYTVMGGLKAVVITDIFQVIFLICIVTAIFGYCASGELGAFFSLGAIGSNQAKFASFGTSFYKQLPILITSALYPLFGQDLAQRFFAARTKRIAVTSALLASAIIVAFSFIPVYFGMKAKFLGLAIPVGSSSFYAVIQALTSDLVLAIVGCALIAAITSTADSLLCAVSSNITQDFELKFSSVRSQLFFSKVITCVAGVIGMGIAYYSQDILTLLYQSYELLISSLFIPILFCFFPVVRKKTAAALSILGGSLAFAGLKVCSLYGVYDVSGITLVVLPILVSLLGYLIGYAFGRPVIVKEESAQNVS